MAERDGVKDKNLPGLYEYEDTTGSEKMADTHTHRKAGKRRDVLAALIEDTYYTVQKFSTFIMRTQRGEFSCLSKRTF